MDDEANRCWCGSTLKGKPHNCIGTQGRVEGLRSENLNLREAIRGEREKNGVLSIWLKEEGDKVKALERENSEYRKALEEIVRLQPIMLPNWGSRDMVKVAVNALAGKQNCEHVFVNYQCEKCGKGQESAPHKMEHCKSGDCSRSDGCKCECPPCLTIENF